ncbi:hypothetical protein ISS04_00645 [Candidatus Woesearchaeota archaeon]|nr:hypothetical protein [Candidatus Woesearchaeota archaeon]
MKCLMCKTVGVFERGLCASCAKKEIFNKVRNFKKDFFGSVPSPFIGHYNYPNINVGILSLQDIRKDASSFDAPSEWATLNKGVYDILDYRSALVNARKKSNVYKIEDITRLVGIATKPVEMEIDLKKKPRFGLNFNSEASPYGPNVEVKKAKITENVKIARAVEKVNDDIDLKSNNALSYLYKKGFDENFLSKLLSVGSVGIGKDRRLVPTRWSITAVDDSMSKQMINELKDFNEINYDLYFGGYLGNYYLVCFFPGEWSFELFESYVEKKVNQWSKSNLRYATDYENVFGRKEYAKETAGGYYAARLPVSEKLKSLKRKGSVLVFRFITEEYTVPLGVWVVRESIRKALKNKPLNFGNKELMLKYAKIFVKKKFGVEIDEMIRKSILLKELKTQKRLLAFV